MSRQMLAPKPQASRTRVQLKQIRSFSMVILNVTFVHRITDSGCGFAEHGARACPTTLRLRYVPKPAAQASRRNRTRAFLQSIKMAFQFMPLELWRASMLQQGAYFRLLPREAAAGISAHCHAYPFSICRDQERHSSL